MQTNWTKLRLLAAAGAISWMGSTLTTFTVALRYKDEFGPNGVSAIMLAMILPTILAAPYGGVLADRIDSKILIPSLLTVMGVASYMISFDWGFIWALILLAITAACGTPVGASFNATLANYATPEDLPRVNGLMQTGSSVGAMFGPGVAGFLVSTTHDYAWPFRIDGISFWILALAIIALKINRAPVKHEEQKKVKAIDGLKLIMQNQLVRAMVILIAMIILAVSVINIGEIFLVMNELHADAFTYGLVSATFSLGAVGGAVLTSIIKVPEKRHAPIVVLALLVLSLITLALAFAWHWLFVAAVWLIAGVFNAALNAYGISLISNRTPEELRGRVMAAVQALFSAASVIGMGIAGLLISFFGIRSVLGFAGAICLAIIALLAPAVFKANRLLID